MPLSAGLPILTGESYMNVLNSNDVEPEQSSVSGLPPTLQVSVATPCIGTQKVDKVNSYTYTGAAGDFTLANLYVIVENGEDSWELQIINFKQSPDGCFGVTIYRLENPSGSPIGTYCRWDGSSKDCSAGQATVA